MIRRATITTIVGLALSLAGCAQGIGDRCQVTGDCQDNLICELPPGASAVTGGTCQKQASFDGGSTTDLQLAADLSAAAQDLAEQD